MFSLGQKLKWPKRCEKHIYNHTRVVLCKKPLEKTPNIREMRRFLKIRPCKGHSRCKMASLGQKLKWPKRLRKTVVKEG